MMENSFMIALAYILFGGVCSGIFAVPFKRNKGWKWENNWFIWAIVALVVMPWITGLITVPQLMMSITVDMQCLILVVLFGLIWGYGAILFGKGIDLLGVSLGLPIMLGLINSVGTLMPIAIKSPSVFGTPQGLKVVLGVAVILIGIVIYSFAGNRKIKAENNKSQNKETNNNFKKGLIICILAGVFGPMLNFAFVFGEPMKETAILNGALMTNAANPIWCVALSAGFIANAIACYKAFVQNKSWSLYKSNRVGIAFAACGGLIWYASILLYGMGSNLMGEQGASIGWATMQSTAIIAGAIAGVIAGEWRTAGRTNFLMMIIGILFLIVGVIIIASQYITLNTLLNYE